MARGWESKAVAEQIEEGKRESSQPTPTVSNAEERQRVAALESLRLNRSRLLEQLDKAQHPAHREMLLKALKAIEQQMEETSSRNPSSPIKGDKP
jgi:hypothetical protein